MPDELMEAHVELKGKEWQRRDCFVGTKSQIFG